MGMYLCVILSESRMETMKLEIVEGYLGKIL